MNLPSITLFTLKNQFYLHYKAESHFIILFDTTKLKLHLNKTNISSTRRAFVFVKFRIWNHLYIFFHTLWHVHSLYLSDSNFVWTESKVSLIWWENFHAASQSVNINWTTKILAEFSDGDTISSDLSTLNDVNDRIENTRAKIIDWMENKGASINRKTNRKLCTQHPD